MTTRRERGRRAAPAVLVLVVMLVAGCVGPETAIPECEAGGRLAILAQSLPSATLVPCIEQMPVGWSFDALDVDSGQARFWLHSDRAGLRAAEVQLVGECDVSGATSVDSEEADVRRYQRLNALSPRFIGSTYDVFDGGCVIYRYELTAGSHIGLYQEIHDAVGLFPRQALGDELRADLGLDLDPQ